MPEYENPADRGAMLAAWSLIVLAMILAALVVVMGLAGQIAAQNRPTQPHSWITPGPDTIAPPPALQRPCDPIFQKCAVTE